MSTPETPADSIEAFAADLRRLRLRADQPTLESLARESNISRTVLSETLNGRQLPSARTVDRLVRILGGDVDVWVRRRDLLTSPPNPTVIIDPRPDEPVSAPPRTIRRRTGLILAAATFLIGVVCGGGGMNLVSNSAATATKRTGEEQVVDGANPLHTVCVSDAHVIASAAPTDDVRVDLVWSDRCAGGWGRVTRIGDQHLHATMDVRVFTTSATEPAREQAAQSVGVTHLSTPLLLAPSSEIVCVRGEITEDGESVDLGPAVCG